MNSKASTINTLFEEFSLKSSRCQRCSQRIDDCLCRQLLQIHQKTDLNIVMHHREAVITSNTARLAKLTFNNVHIHLRGVPNMKIDWEKIICKQTQPLYLYPDENAIELGRIKDFFPQAEKFNLIIPDGSWRQTKKFQKRELPLQTIPTVKLPQNLKGNYLLRKSRFENYLSTFEAIAYALDYLENSAISEIALKNFHLFVQKHLNHRHPSKTQSGGPSDSCSN